MQRALVSLVAVSAAVVCAVPAAAGAATSTTYPKYANCKAMNAKYPHGVGRTGARDHTTGKPVTTFTRNTKLYNVNAARDRDKDGIACEKR